MQHALELKVFLFHLYPLGEKSDKPNIDEALYGSGQCFLFN